MHTLTDVAAVALAGLRARRLRNLLVAVGPMIGVAALVSIIGLSQSAHADVRRALAELGTNLIVVDPAPQAATSPRCQQNRSTG